MTALTVCNDSKTGVCISEIFIMCFKYWKTTLWICGWMEGKNSCVIFDSGVWTTYLTNSNNLLQIPKIFLKILLVTYSLCSIVHQKMIWPKIETRGSIIFPVATRKSFHWKWKSNWREHCTEGFIGCTYSKRLQCYVCCLERLLA